MPRTGFLPEPIPTADVEPRRLEAEIEALKTFAVSRSPNVTSRLFKSVKKDAFLRSCKGLNVEQALATYPTILKSGLDASTVRITMADVRALAEKIGNDATPGIVEEALADTRLFRDWVKAVAKRIASDHFNGNTVNVYLDVPHLDIPKERSDSAQIIFHIPSRYCEETEEYENLTYVCPVEWHGRHVIRKSWVDFVVSLMRIICDLTD